MDMSYAILRCDYEDFLWRPLPIFRFWTSHAKQAYAQLDFDPCDQAWQTRQRLVAQKIISINSGLDTDADCLSMISMIKGPFCISCSCGQITIKMYVEWFVVMILFSYLVRPKVCKVQSLSVVVVLMILIRLHRTILWAQSGSIKPLSLSLSPRLRIEWSEERLLYSW